MLQYSDKLISDYEFSKLLKKLDEIENTFGEKVDVKIIAVEESIRRIKIKVPLFTILLDTYGQVQLKKDEFDFKSKCFGKVFYKSISIQEFELYDTMVLYNWWENKLLKEQRGIIEEGNKLLGWNPKFMYKENL